MIKINESVGDIKIVKAVILAPNYLPKRAVDKVKVVVYGVHAIYSTYLFNKDTLDYDGTPFSHTDIEIRNKLETGKVIGYFSSEGNKVIDCNVMKNWASKFLSGGQMKEVKRQLNQNRW